MMGAVEHLCETEGEKPARKDDSRFFSPSVFLLRKNPPPSSEGGINRFPLEGEAVGRDKIKRLPLEGKLAAVRLTDEVL